MHTAIVDWDGTAVPAMWPERPTEFMPGFVENMNRLYNAGIHIIIDSARISPLDPFTKQLRDPGHRASEIQYIRNMLDVAGLTFIDIWTKHGKPGGSVYIDDKAERYNGCVKCWDKVATRVLLRLGKETPLFPAFREQEAV